MSNEKKESDIEITVVENGYVASVKDTVYIFPDLKSVMDWLEKSISTPKDAKDFISTKTQKPYFNEQRLDKLAKKYYPMAPFTQPTILPYIQQPQPFYTTTTSTTK